MLYTTLEDAIRDQEQKGGRINFIGIGDGNTDKQGIKHYKKKIWVLTESKTSDLCDGFLPIQNLIYDMTRISLAKTIELVESRGCEPLGCKTDAVLISYEDSEKFDDIKWKDEIDGCKISNLGTLKKEKTILPKQLMKHFKHDAPHEWINHKAEVITYYLKDEYSQDEADQVFDTYNRVMLRAENAKKRIQWGI